MPVINYQPTNFQPIRFTPAPSTGLAIASSAFKSINDTLTKENAAKSLAQYQADTLQLAQDKQNFAEAAPQRLLDAAAVERKRTNKQGQIFSDIVANSGGERKSAFLEHNIGAIANSPGGIEIMKQAGLSDGVGPLPEGTANPLFDAFDTFASQNKRSLSDPRLFAEEVSRKALDAVDANGNPIFSANDVTTKTDAASKSLFTTLDPAIAKSLIQKQGSGNVYIGSDGITRSTGGGGTGTQRLLSQPLDAADSRASFDNFFALNSINKTSSNSQLPEFVGGGRILDPGEVDINQEDVVKFAAQMAQSSKGSPGVQQQYALAALQTQLNNGTIPKRIDKLSSKDLDEFKVIARDLQFTQERTFTTRGGAGNSGQIFANNSNVLNRLKPDQFNNNQLLADFISGLPKGSSAVPPPPPPVPVPPPAGASRKPNPQGAPGATADTGSTKAQPDGLIAPILDAGNSTPTTILSNNAVNLNDPLSKGFGLLDPNNPNIDRPAMNNSLRKLRTLGTGKSIFNDISVQELKMVLDHPGASSAEVAKAEKLLKQKVRAGQTPRGFRG